MYVIAGATGRVGSTAARSLLEAGAPVRVVVRREADAGFWEAQGAQAWMTDLENRASLGDALREAEGFFVLLPFDLSVDDMTAHADALIDSISGAVADAEVDHVVMLSSGGADLEEGTGPINGLHRLEKELLGTGTTLTALRSGHFQEKVLDVIDAARSEGVYPVFASSADVARPMAATVDIGEVVAQMLLARPHESEVVDVLGPSYSERTVATVLGDALGHALDVAVLPQEAWVGVLLEAGFRPHVANSLAELHRADELGLLQPRGDREIRTATTIEETIGALLATDRR